MFTLDVRPTSPAAQNVQTQKPLAPRESGPILVSQATGTKVRKGLLI